MRRPTYGLSSAMTEESTGRSATRRPMGRSDDERASLTSQSSPSKSALHVPSQGQARPTITDAPVPPKFLPAHSVERPSCVLVTPRQMVRVLVGGPAARNDGPTPVGLAPLVDAAVRELRDAGHEVVLATPGVSSAQLAAAAVQEDVVAVGLSASDDMASALPYALAAYDAG